LRLAPVLLCLALTACSDGGAVDEPDALPTATNALPAVCASLQPGATQVPAECVEQGPDAPPEVPTGRYPATSAEIAAVTLPAAPTDLARGGNDADPALTTRAFTVTVPRGRRLQVTAACDGATFLDVDTEPASNAELRMSCFEEGAVSELTVGDDVVQGAPKQFRVTVTTQAPSRWFAAVGSTADPLPSPGT
jgi:hypothetical protein